MSIFSTKIPKDHLPGVDGLRGAAALFIFVYHLYGYLGAPQLRIGGHLNVLRPLQDGWSGVTLFLVLSGFCLSLPYFRNPDRVFSFRDFMMRRVRRIIPAYYVSLLLFPLIALGIQHFVDRQVFFPPYGLPDIFLHLTMLHALWYKSFHTINGVVWTLSLEWTWYLAFPLILLLWRKKGFIPALGTLTLVTIVYRVLAWKLFKPDPTLSEELELCRIMVTRSFLPGLIAIFGIGMGVAWYYVHYPITKLTMRLAAAAIVVCLVAAQLFHSVNSMLPLLDFLYGFAYAALLLLVISPISNVAKHVFCWRPLVFTGIVSYSLYLYHLPFCRLPLIIQPNSPHSGMFFLICAVVMAPPLVGLSWILYSLFEKPFFAPRRSQSPTPPVSAPATSTPESQHAITSA